VGWSITDAVGQLAGWLGYQSVDSREQLAGWVDAEGDQAMRHAIQRQKGKQAGRLAGSRAFNE
jgi:hypothetical protein